jgi:1-acyl-sn-glycerol-3-phosphate acyltransferase
VRYLVSYSILLLVKLLSRLFYRHESGWVGDPGDDPWGGDVRICAILHHTSLYEPVFAAVAPNRFLKRIAREGVIPIADKTLERPLVGQFFRWVAADVVPVTRQRDETWREVVRHVGPGKVVLLLPEGRMKRTSGLDFEGKPMTVRGGIADLIDAVGGGWMLLAYSGGLHHVQAPGERLPRLFQTVRMNLELVDLAGYRAELHARMLPDESFRRVVVRDLERRRDLYSPTEGKPVGIPDPEAFAKAESAKQEAAPQDEVLAKAEVERG